MQCRFIPAGSFRPSPPPPPPGSKMHFSFITLVKDSKLYFIFLPYSSNFREQGNHVRDWKAANNSLLHESCLWNLNSSCSCDKEILLSGNFQLHHIFDSWAKGKASLFPHQFSLKFYVRIVFVFKDVALPGIQLSPLWLVPFTATPDLEVQNN